jgi:hypothetical protein
MGNRKLGVHHDQGWCMQIDDKVVCIDSEQNCVPLAPILEVEAASLWDFLMEASKMIPSHSAWIKKFPAEMLLKHIFNTSFSGYWPEKALAWVASDKNLQTALRANLEKFINNNVMPQAARQKAKKLVQQTRS